jgi:hypothetical protein
MEFWHLSWRFGHASVRSSAAMLWDCNFLLPSGRPFSPLARAPWARDSSFDPQQPAHLRHLGGEFVCVPFGNGGTPVGLLPQWSSAAWAQANAEPHGRSANNKWECIASDSSQVTLRLSYPVDDDIAYLIRRLSVVADAPAIDLELTIHARRCTRQPVGLHPIVRLPQLPAQLAIEAAFEFGLTYPAIVPPGISRVAPGQRFRRLGSIPGIHGGRVDYSRMPQDAPTEEMLMLCTVRGPVVVRFLDERAAFHLSWDTSILPSCLLWPSDSAFTDPPWSGFRGLGIEPVAAAFDASREVCLRSNPLNELGVATAVDIAPSNPLTIRYRLAVLDDDPE